jgi:hypothetical protein
VGRHGERRVRKSAAHKEGLRGAPLLSRGPPAPSQHTLDTHTQHSPTCVNISLSSCRWASSPTPTPKSPPTPTSHLREHLLEQLQVGLRVEGRVERQHRARALQVVARQLELVHGVDVLGRGVWGGGGVCGGEQRRTATPHARGPGHGGCLAAAAAAATGPAAAAPPPKTPLVLDSPPTCTRDPRQTSPVAGSRPPPPPPRRPTCTRNLALGPAGVLEAHR